MANFLSLNKIVGLTIRDLLEYLGRLVDERAAEPRDDIISHLAVNYYKPGVITKADVVQNAFLLLVAGNATMVNMITLVS